jgi:hypothetical protein
VVAGQHRHHPRPAAADFDQDAAGAADDVGAAHGAQVGADQPGARAQADQPGGAHPPRRRRLRIGQGEVAADLGGGIRGLRALAGQRRVRRIELRDHPAGDIPQVRPQRPPGHAGQARRVRGEPLDHRRVQQHLRRRLQAQPGAVAGELPRGPQQVLRPLPPGRRRGRHDLPGERGRLRRR